MPWTPIESPLPDDAVPSVPFDMRVEFNFPDRQYYACPMRNGQAWYPADVVGSGDTVADAIGEMMERLHALALTTDLSDYADVDETDREWVRNILEAIHHFDQMQYLAQRHLFHHPAAHRGEHRGEEESHPGLVLLQGDVDE